MYTETPVAKFRPRYSGKRIEDKAVLGGELTHPLDRTGATPNYETLPLKSEMVLDFGRFLNCLVVRHKNGKFVRQTPDREEILEMLDEVYFGNEGAVLAPESRNLLTGHTGLYYGNCSAADNAVAKIPMSMFREKNDGKITDATEFANLSAMQFAQIMVRGYAQGSVNTVLSPSWAIGPQLPGAVAEAHSNYGSSGTAGLPIVKDFNESNSHKWTKDWRNAYAMDAFNLRWLHSSALSFIYQWRTELKNLASQTQYLSQELVGFYEKGLKGEFLRHFSKAETALMISLVELGAAIRRKAFVSNSYANTTNTPGLKGCFNLFFTAIEGSVESTAAAGYGSGTYEAGAYMKPKVTAPWWLSLAIDKYHFEHSEDADDVRDIHREDLFHGLRLLMEAASFEYGMMIKSVGTPYLEFFDDFENAVLPDLTVMDDVPTLRTLWYNGVESAEEWELRDHTNTDRNMVWSKFKDFIKDDQIVQTARLDLQRDVAELDKLPFISGSYVKQGMQFVGPFEHTVHHRLTRFGSHSIDVQYIPYVLYRPLRYIGSFKKASADTDNNTGITSVGSVGALDTVAKATAFWNSTSSAQAGVVTNSVGYAEWIGFPSIKAGWASFGDGVTHPSNHPTLGYGSIHVGSQTFGLAASTTLNVTGSGANFPSKAAFIDDWNGGAGTLPNWSNQGGVPLCPEGYWNLGYNGLLSTLVRRTNEVYKAWQGRTSGLFRRSELKNLLNWSSYNLKRELKMNTPDPYFAKFGKEMAGLMNCGATGWDPGLVLRHVDRKLDDASVHGRTSTGLYGSGTAGDELNADTVMSPFTMEATSLEDVFLAQHMMGFLMGMYGERSYNKPIYGGLVMSGSGTSFTISHNGTRLYGIPGSVAITSTAAPWQSRYLAGSVTTATSNKLALNRFNASANEYPLYPRLTGPGVPTFGSHYMVHAATSLSTVSNDIYERDNLLMPAKLSCLRTFYHHFKSLDGDETKVSVTPMWKTSQGTYDDVVANAAALNAVILAPSIVGGGANRSNSTTMHAQNQPMGMLTAPVFNFRTETVGNMDTTNGTTYDLLPGHRYLYQVWKVFETAANNEKSPNTFGTVTGSASFPVVPVTTPVPSLCSTFGISTIATPTGSSVPGLSGFKAADGIIGLTAAEWIVDHNGKWLQYLERRSGGMPEYNSSTNLWDAGEPLDIRVWREAAPKLFIYDQDVFDTAEGMLGSLLYMIHGITHPGQVTFAAVLGADGAVDYEIRDSYGWGDASTATSEGSNLDAAESATGEKTVDYTSSD